MTEPAPAPPALHPVRWLNNQPYLLLSLTSLFWAGNIVLARHVAGHVPPMTLSCVRWIGSFLILLPFAWPHLKHDWPALRARLAADGAVVGDRICHQQRDVLLGAAIYPGAERAADPVVGTAVRGTVVAAAVRHAADGAQLAGITISLAGVLTIILRGDFTALPAIQFNKGDLMFAGAMFAFGLIRR